MGRSVPEPPREIALLRAAARLAEKIAQDTGPAVAAAWVHAPVLARHAEQAGAAAGFPDGGDPVSVIRGAVERLASAHPLLDSLADQAVAPIWETAPAPGDAARILDLWRSADLLPGLALDGYLPGDVYEAVSGEPGRARALRQTPRFVTRLLLDLSWEHAAGEWGRGRVRMIDPACGTGHILTEALARAWNDLGPRLPDRERAQRALAAVHGADVDPYAAAVARYRLLVLACRLSGPRLRLDDLPRDVPVRVSAVNSLLGEDPVLERGRYHAVVANPPYVTCKDRAQQEELRRRYPVVCKGRFPLYVPFEPLMHDLCVSGGWVARLTANSFMKREFGKPLIEDYFTTIDLQWIIDTSGAYIPGHGTPTVILASRNQPPSGDTVKTVFGKKGEPSVSFDPAKGKVWTAIVGAVRRREAADAAGRPRPGCHAPAGSAQNPEPGRGP